MCTSVVSVWIGLGVMRTKSFPLRICWEDSMAGPYMDLGHTDGEGDDVLAGGVRE